MSKVKDFEDQSNTDDISTILEYYNLKLSECIYIKEYNQNLMSIITFLTAYKVENPLKPKIDEFISKTIDDCILKLKVEEEN